MDVPGAAEGVTGGRVPASVGVAEGSGIKVAVSTPAIGIGVRVGRGVSVGGRVFVGKGVSEGGGVHVGEGVKVAGGTLVSVTPTQNDAVRPSVSR